MTTLAFSLPDRRRLLGMAIPFIAVVGSMIIGLLLIAASDKSVPDAIEAFLDGAFGTAFAVGASINRAVALSLVGLGFILAFRANLTNVGGEGQIAVGGIAAAALADGGFERDGAAPTEPVPVYFMLEQRQNPESRLTLAEERDALGVPRVRLEWRFTSQDEVNMRSAVRAFAREFGEAGQGRVRCEWPEKSPVEEYSHSRHHIGTTRMHPDPEHGVVDADARVHGVANLWIAGSSIFPTPGIANPTLTIVALALRLADHLARELGA